MGEKKNVMIFIDYENLHKTLIKNNQNLIGTLFFEKLKKWCEEKCLRILDIKVYCNFDIDDLYQSHHQSKLQEYGIETYHTSNKGKNYSDLKITTDLLEELYENSNIDGFIIISNDKDMTPLIKIIKRYKEFVYLLTNQNSYDINLRNFPDEIYILEETVFKIKEEKIKNEIKNYKKYEENIVKSLEDYVDNTRVLKNRDLEYIIKSNIPYFKLPNYEILYHYKNAVQNLKLEVYKYKYNEKDLYSVYPTSKKEVYLNNNLFVEGDILTKEKAVEFLEKEIEKSYSIVRN